MNAKTSVLPALLSSLTLVFLGGCATSQAFKESSLKMKESTGGAAASIAVLAPATREQMLAQEEAMALLQRRQDNVSVAEQAYAAAEATRTAAPEQLAKIEANHHHKIMASDAYNELLALVENSSNEHLLGTSGSLVKLYAHEQSSTFKRMSILSELQCKLDQMEISALTVGKKGAAANAAIQKRWDTSNWLELLAVADGALGLAAVLVAEETGD